MIWRAQTAIGANSHELRHPPAPMLTMGRCSFQKWQFYSLNKRNQKSFIFFQGKGGGRGAVYLQTSGLDAIISISWIPKVSLDTLDFGPLGTVFYRQQGLWIIHKRCPTKHNSYFSYSSILESNIWENLHQKKISTSMKWLKKVWLNVPGARCCHKNLQILFFLLKAF